MIYNYISFIIITLKYNYIPIITIIIQLVFDIKSISLKLKIEKNS